MKIDSEEGIWKCQHEFTLRLKKVSWVALFTTSSSKLLIDFSKRTNNLLSTISFTKDVIANIIKNLNPNKAHGFDIISIRMLKICGASILKHLELIFKS